MWLTSIGCIVWMVMGSPQQQWMPLTLPAEVGEWKWDGKTDTYDADTIFDYIDGIGEVYRAYNMQRVWVRRYTKADSPTLTVDLFQMSTPEDAFGVFTFERDGEDTGIGQGSDYAGGMLRFWKDRYFVVISAQEENEAVRQAVLQLGKAIAQAIPRTAPLPSLLQALPTTGMSKNSVLFFRHPMILNRHFFVADKDVLNLSPRAEGVLALYPVGRVRMRVVVIRYPSEADAVKAWNTFSQAYLRGGRQKGIVQTENRRWAAAKRVGRTLAIVFDAPSRREAEEMLKRVRIHEQEAQHE
ncbi:MAG: hypothetical protein KatS3mg022_2520 [Armatimonadota bacterium]|nr:MAG: hypothetical protein KatS3mg022_2520 [Armatimonadota bacterium]